MQRVNALLKVVGFFQAFWSPPMGKFTGQVGINTVRKVKECYKHKMALEVTSLSKYLT